jgi:hypothetical protein
VTDADGKPIHAARVWVRVEPIGAQYPRSRNQILQKQRLPVVFTSRDGGFVLPLTHAQRLLSTPVDGHFSLVVEKAGYQTWIEPLGGGLRGYRGSRVSLRRLGPKDRFQVRVQEPVPGAKLLVRRYANPSLGNQPHVNLTRVVDVPADGVVEVAMALVPNPPVIVGNHSYLPLSRDVQLLYPGRSSSPIPVAFGQKVVHIKTTAPADARPPRVVAGDDKPLRGLRGLCTCPDGKNRWFELPAGTLARGPILSPRMVTAEGCVVQSSMHVDDGRLILERAPASTSPRVLRILDSDGKPLPGAVVGCYEMTALRDVNNPWYGPGTAWRVWRADINGDVTIPDAVDRKPSVLMVEAPGHSRQNVERPRSIVGRREIRMAASSHGSLKLTLQTSDGIPLVGAYLRFPDNCYSLGGILGRIPRTGEDGSIELDHIPHGSHSVQVVAKGVVSKQVRVQIKSGGVRRVSATIESAVVLQGVTVAEDDSPVAFSPIQPYVNHRLRNLRVPGALVTDSQGRFVLHGIPEQAMSVTVRSMQQPFRFVNHPMDLDGGVSKVPVADTSLLLLQMPKANPVERVVTYVLNQRRQMIQVPSTHPTVATLVRWAKTGNVSLFFQLSSGPPLRIDADVVQNAGLEVLNGGPGPVVEVVGEQPIRRRIPVTFEGGDGIEGDRLRLEISNVGGARPYVYEDLGLGVTKDKDGKWWFLARDDGSYRGRLLHPQLLEVDFDVPAKPTTGAEKPIKVKLERGVPLSFVLHLGKQRLNLNNNLNVRLRDQARRNYVLYWHQPVGSVDHELDDKDGNHVMRLRSPVALRPGKYNVHLRLYGTQVSLNTNITVAKNQEPVVLEFEHGRLKQKQRPPRAGVQTHVGPQLPKSGLSPADRARLEKRAAAVGALERRLNILEKQLSAAGLAADEKARLEKMVADMSRQIAVLKAEIARKKAQAANRVEKKRVEKNAPAAPPRR